MKWAHKQRVAQAMAARMVRSEATFASKMNGRKSGGMRRRRRRHGVWEIEIVGVQIHITSSKILPHDKHESKIIIMCIYMLRGVCVYLWARSRIPSLSRSRRFVRLACHSFVKLTPARSIIAFINFRNRIHIHIHYSVVWNGPQLGEIQHSTAQNFCRTNRKRKILLRSNSFEVSTGFPPNANISFDILFSFFFFLFFAANWIFELFPVLFCGERAQCEQFSNAIFIFRRFAYTEQWTTRR